MAGSPLVLRVRSKKGLTKLSSLSTSSTIDELRKSIADLTGIELGRLKVLCGYPPKPLDSLTGCSTLISNHIKDGELFTCEEMSEANPSKTTTSSSSSNVTSSTINNNTHSLSNNGNKVNNGGGQLLRKVVPANNSCLFTSVYFVMQDGLFDLECQKMMRELIAATVKSDPITFNEAILGRKNKEYCEWIRDSSSWGGSIEIMILSKYYKVEICVVDIRTGRIDRFGEDCDYPKRVFIIYDGIHFDPLYWEPFSGLGIQTKFPTSNDAVMVDAMRLADEAKDARQFTDVNNFKLRCLVCQQPLVGQNEAQEHAKKTGHINFGEF